ncbi:MAG: flagellar basal body-associated protein FliL [Gammaproteobacteria bacterium]
MADEEAQEGQEGKKPSLIKKIALPLVIGLVSSGATFGGLKFSGMLDPAPPEAAETEMPTEGGEMAAAGSSSHVGKPAFFFTLYPDLLVNFSSDGRPAYLKLAVDVMSHDEEAIKGVEEFQAIIRNNLLSAFQAVDFDSTQRQESIEAMRVLALEETRGVLTEYYGNQNVEGVYFTSFVVQ